MIGRSAKSHRYYYYMCNGSYTQGKDSCGARSLPKDRLESRVIEQTKEKVLTQECLEELVKLLNEELNSTQGLLKDKLDAIELSRTMLRAL